MTKSNMAKKTPQARRSAILAIAWEAFLREGYAGTSMSSIAARLGGSKGTLYNYFSSKEELLAEVVREKSEEVYAQLVERDGEPIEDGQAGFRQTMRQVGIKLLKILMSPEILAFYRLMIGEAARFPEIGDVVYGTARGLALAPVSDLIAAAARAGEIAVDDPPYAAELFFDLCGAVIHRRGLIVAGTQTSDSEIAANAERAVSLFMSAYAAPARS